MAGIDVTKYHPPLTENNSVDTEFLSSSHFSLGQDLCQVKDSMQSVFRLDYNDPGASRRQAPVDPPVLGEVMHKDEKHFNDNYTETLKSFQYRYLPKPDLQYDHDTIGQTNFKMDKDLNKFSSFDTTHYLQFPSLVGKSVDPPARRRVPSKNVSESSLPNGDPKQGMRDQSDYSEKFRGHDTSVVKVPRVSGILEGLPTLKGDQRLNNFDTSHKDIFQGKWLPRVTSIPMTRVISVPQGDPQKVVTKSTTMWDSYTECPTTNNNGIQKLVETTLKMRKSNHHDKDGHKTWEDFHTVAKKAFPYKQTKVERAKPAVERNHSDLPSGDLDPERAQARISSTINNFHFGNPALGHVNPITVGAMILTRSNVKFGEPRLGGAYYQASTDLIHRPLEGPKYNRVRASTQCNIPLRYYKDGVNPATTSQDYPNPAQGRLVPNPEMIRSLTESHIHAPLGRRHLFNTTHTDTFTTKTAERHTFDPHRMQVSSVPLGTLPTQTPRYGEVCQ